MKSKTAHLEGRGRRTRRDNMGKGTYVSSPLLLSFTINGKSVEYLNYASLPGPGDSQSFK